MSASYSVEHVAGTGVVRLRLIGYWDSATAQQLGIALRETLRSLAAQGYGPGRYALLADFSQSVVQSATITEHYKALGKEFGPGATHIAVVAPSMLIRMQTKRQTDLDNIAFFDTEEKAMRWIAGD